MSMYSLTIVDGCRYKPLTIFFDVCSRRQRWLFVKQNVRVRRLRRLSLSLIGIR